MLEQEYFTKKEIVETLRNAKDYDVDSFEDLFNSMFNDDYYIMYAYNAVVALEAFQNDQKLDGYETELDGTFGAIELVKQYELKEFGEVNTSLEDPVKLANMVEYIRGEVSFKKALNIAGLDFDSETTAENIQKFIKATEKL